MEWLFADQFIEQPVVMETKRRHIPKSSNRNRRIDVVGAVTSIMLGLGLTTLAQAHRITWNMESSQAQIQVAPEELNRATSYAGNRMDSVLSIGSLEFDFSQLQEDLKKDLALLLHSRHELSDEKEADLIVRSIMGDDSK